MKYKTKQYKKIKRKNWKLRIFILSLALSPITYPLFPIHPASAQEVVRTITIVPPTIEKTLNPGDKTEGILKVINDTEVPLNFTSTIEDFTVQDTQGTPQLLPPNTLSNKYSAASWIGISPENFTVPPHQRKELQYFIQIPNNARPGGHYAAVTYKPNKNVGVQGTGANIETVIGSLFYIQVNGPIQQNAKVTKFTANGFQEYGPIQIQTQIQNLGDLHIKPGGFITVKNMLGSKSYTLPLAEHNIFPQAARDYSNIFGSHWMLGRYQATFNAMYGTDKNLPLTATLYFWVFPWKLALVIILAITALILGILYWNKKKNTPKQPTNNPTPNPKPASSSPTPINPTK